MKASAFLFLAILASCTTTQSLNDIPKYNDTELIPFQRNSKWGFIDLEDNLHIEPRYDSVSFFYNGVAKIKMGNKYGLIRKDNSYLLKPKYDHVEEFHNNHSQVTKNKKSKYIDSNGKVLKNRPPIALGCGLTTTIIKGTLTKVGDNYELVTEWRKKVDSSYVKVLDTTNLQADTIIDYSGNYIQVVKNGKIGITRFNYKPAKETIIKPEQLKYDSISYNFGNEGSLRYAKVKDGDFWGIINDQGYETVKPKYLRILTDLYILRYRLSSTPQSLYKNHKKLLVKYEPEKYGYIDVNGKEYFRRE